MAGPMAYDQIKSVVLRMKQAADPRWDVDELLVLATVPGGLVGLMLAAADEEDAASAPCSTTLSSSRE